MTGLHWNDLRHFGRRGLLVRPLSIMVGKSLPNVHIYVRHLSAGNPLHDLHALQSDSDDQAVGILAVDFRSFCS